jgi:hypothetical protein
MLSPASAEAIPDVILIEGDVPRKLAGAVAEGENWQAAPGRFLLRGGSRAGRFLVEGGKKITLERNPAAEEPMLVAHLLASVLASLLRQRGLLVLHANTAVTPHGAVVVSGETGAGKSTTLAALLARGCTMLADDITVMRLGQTGLVEILPGIPKFTLCEDAANNLGHIVEDLPRNPLRSIKVVLAAENVMVLKPVPLYAIYQLRLGSGSRLNLTPLNGADKFAALQECIYGPFLPDEHPGQFSLFAAVTNQVKFFRLERPSSGWSVDEITEVICRG